MFNYTIKLFLITGILFSGSAQASESDIKKCLKLQHKAYLISRTEGEEKILQAIEQYAPDIYEYSADEFRHNFQQLQNFQSAAEDLIDYHHEWLKDKQPNQWLLYLHAGNNELSPRVKPIILEPYNEHTKDNKDTNEIVISQIEQTNKNSPYLSNLRNNPELAETYNALKVQAIEKAAQNGVSFQSSNRKLVSSIDCFETTQQSLKILIDMDIDHFFKSDNRKRDVTITEDINTVEHKPDVQQPSEPNTVKPPSNSNKYLVPKNKNVLPDSTTNKNSPANRYIVLPQ